jgi:glutaminase
MADRTDHPFVSTGHLPGHDRTNALLQEAYARYRTNTDGECSQVYPALARVSPDLFGLCVVGTDGDTTAAGDSEHRFAIMSVSKPFVFALVCQCIGSAAARKKLGANATGLPFNSIEALDRHKSGRTNPMVNSGALATTSLVPGATFEEKWKFIHEGLSRFAGRTLTLDEEVYRSALETHHRNHGIAWVLHGLGQLASDPRLTVDLYTRQCALAVSAKDLAVMGATLADGGVNPLTGERVVDDEVCHYAAAVTATAGMYETSGDWLYEVGVPGKSGIGGGIVTIAPGKGALGTFGPRLDAAGNSVKGQLAAIYLAKSLGLSLFASRPHAAKHAR